MKGTGWLQGLTLAAVLGALAYVLLQQEPPPEPDVPLQPTVQQQPRRPQELIARPWRQYEEPPARPTWAPVPEQRQRAVRQHLHRGIVDGAAAAGLDVDQPRDRVHLPAQPEAALAVNGIVELLMEDILADGFSADELQTVPVSAFDHLVAPRLQRVRATLEARAAAGGV
jgi:hypothetical protein